MRMRGGGYLSRNRIKQQQHKKLEKFDLNANQTVQIIQKQTKKCKALIKLNKKKISYKFRTRDF